MRSPIRPVLLAASVLFACGGFSGCSSESESPSGKMDAGQMDTGKMSPPMDKMDKDKMK